MATAEISSTGLFYVQLMLKFVCVDLRGTENYHTNVVAIEI